MKLHYSLTYSTQATESIRMIEWMRTHAFTSLDLSASPSVLFPEIFPLLRRRLADCTNLHCLVLVDMLRYHAIVNKHTARLLKNNPTGTLENVRINSDEEREHYLELLQMDDSVDLMRRYCIEDLLDVVFNHQHLNHVDLRRNHLSYRSTLLLINYVHKANSLRSIGLSVGSSEKALNVNHRRLLWAVCSAPNIDTLYVHFDKDFDATLSMAQFPGNIKRLYVSGTVSSEAMRELVNVTYAKRRYFDTISLTDLHVTGDFVSTMRYFLQHSIANAVRFQVENSLEEQPNTFPGPFIDMQPNTWPCTDRRTSSLDVFDAACGENGIVYMNELSGGKEQICKFIKRHGNLALAYYYH